MDFSKILENKPLLYGIIGGVVLFLALVVTISIVGASNKQSNGTEITGEPLKENVDLLTTDNAGKAIEIFSLHTETFIMYLLYRFKMVHII